jgi:hypothetical protein
MAADGWRRAADNGIWTRRGQQATPEFATFDGLPVGRAQIEGNLLQSQWREAGFDLTLKPTTRDTYCKGGRRPIP